MADPLQPAGALVGLSKAPVALTPDSKSALLITGSQTGNTFYGNTVVKIDLATGTPQQSWRVGTQLLNADVSADGRYILATEGQAGQATVVNGSYVVPVYVHRIDTVTGEIVTLQQFVSGNTAAPPNFYDVATLSDGTALLTRGSASDGLTGGYEKLDIASGTFGSASDFAEGDTVAGTVIAASNHSRVLVAATNSPSLYERTATGEVLRFTGDASYTNTDVQAISASGRYSVAQTTNGALYVHDSQLNPAINLSLLRPEFYVPAGESAPQSTVRGAAFSPDEKNLYVYESRTAEVYVLSTADWSLTGIIGGVAGGGGGSLLTSADGRYLTVGGLAVDLTRAVQYDPAADNVVSTLQTGGSYLFGYAGNDTLSTATGTLDGGDGNDTLIATGGASPYYGPTLIGGAGDDSYYAEASLFGFRDPYYFVYPTLVEQPGGGTDTLYAKVGALAANMENIVGISTETNILIGNAQANVITGNSGTDYIAPGLGADTIAFGTGRAILAGTPADLATDRVTGFTTGGSITLSDFTTFSQRYTQETGYQTEDFSYKRIGESLSFAGDGPLTLSGLVGGRFVQSLTYQYSMFSFGYERSFGSTPRVTVTLRPNSANLNDFNGDGHADILWRNVDGRLSTWQVTGNTTPLDNGGTTSTVQQNAYNTLAPAGWTLQGTADFAGDGGSDLLWRNNASGNLAVWAGTGTGGFTPGGYVSGGVDASWKVTALGDFNRDGRDDVLWRNDNGSIDVWRSVAGGGLVAQPVIAVDASWHVQGTGDFYGDGRAGILWRNDNGALSVWLPNAAADNFSVTYNRAMPDKSWHVAGIGDITGDGRSDILWRNDDGRVTYWASADGGFNDSSFVPVQVDTSWKIAGLFDFNDDGRDDILWRNDNGAVTIWQSNGTVFQHGVYNSSAPVGWSIVNTVHDIV